MTKKKPTHESGDKAEEGAEGASPMDRFKSLARQVVNVSNEKVLVARKTAKPKKNMPK